MRFSSAISLCCLLCACSAPPPVGDALVSPAAGSVEPVATRDSFGEALECRASSRDVAARLDGYCAPEGFIRAPYAFGVAPSLERILPWPTEDLVLVVDEDGLVVDGGHETRPVRIAAAIDALLTEHVHMQTVLLNRKPSPTFVLYGHMMAPSAVVAEVLKKMYAEGYPDVWVAAAVFVDAPKLEFSDRTLREVGRLPADVGGRMEGALEVMKRAARGCDDVEEMLEVFERSPEEDRCAYFSSVFADMYQGCGCALDPEVVLAAFASTQGDVVGVVPLRFDPRGAVVIPNLNDPWFKVFKRLEHVDAPIHPF